MKQCCHWKVSSNFKSKLADIKPYDKVDAENTFLNMSLNLRHKFYDQKLEGLVTTIARPFLDFFAYYQ